MAKQTKSKHYWAIHAKVTKREWRNLDQRSRDMVAGDVERASREAKDFDRHVNSETERLYNDPSFYMNDPSSFKYSQFEDITATIKAAQAAAKSVRKK